MTNPPQPGPFDPNNPNAQQHGQPQQQQNWGNTPAQGFSQQQQPGGQFPQHQEGYQGGPGAQPPKKKTGLIAGLVVLGVLIIGGVIALILVLTNKDDDQQPAASGSTPTSAGSGSTATTGSGPGTRTGGSTPTSAQSQPSAPTSSGRATPQELADFVINAYNTKDANGVFNATCPDPDRQVPNIPDGLKATLVGPVTNEGFSFTLTAGEQSGTAKTGVELQNGSWCMSGLKAG